jgi:hypothetical protein
MAEIKTKPGVVSVESFLEKLDDEQQYEANTLIDIMTDVSGNPPVMWGASIVGFGKLTYKYASGRDVEWLRIGFSPRKGKLSLYITNEAEKYIPQLETLGGKYKIGKGCIYLRKLNDVNIDALRSLIQKAYDDTMKIV